MHFFCKKGLHRIFIKSEYGVHVQLMLKNMASLCCVNSALYTLKDFQCCIRNVHGIGMYIMFVTFCNRNVYKVRNMFVAGGYVICIIFWDICNAGWPTKQPLWKATQRPYVDVFFFFSKGLCLRLKSSSVSPLSSHFPTAEATFSEFKLLQLRPDCWESLPSLSYLTG